MQQEMTSDLAVCRQALSFHLSKFAEGLDKADVRDILGDVLLSDVEADIARVRRDLERPFTIAVIGHFNYGKSTLVNALLKQEISPMDILPETYTISEICYGRDEQALVHLKDETVEKYPLKDLPKKRIFARLKQKLTPMPQIDRGQLRDEIQKRFSLDEIKNICFLLDGIDDEDLPQKKTSAIVELIRMCQRRDMLPCLLDVCSSENKAFSRQKVYRQNHTSTELLQLAQYVRKIEVRAALKPLKGIRLIDTPGIGDHQDLDERIQASLPQADVVIFVLLARALLSQGESAFLQRAIDKYDGDKFIFVVNQMDNLSVKEIERVQAFAAERVRAVIPNAAIYYLSAREEFEYTQQMATDQNSLRFHDAFQEFRAHLKQSIRWNRDVMRLEQAIFCSERLLDNFEAQVKQFHRVCRADSVRLNNKVAQLRQPDSPLLQRVMQQRTAVKQEINRFSEQACAWMDEFIDRLTAYTIPGLTEVRLVDIQQEFHFFLSDIVSQAMNLCFDRQRPLLIDTMHNAQESIRQEYDIIMHHTGLLSLDKNDAPAIRPQADWEKLAVYDQLLEQTISTVFSFTHELMHQVARLTDIDKDLPDWQVMDIYKRQLYDSASRLREAVTAEIHILYKQLMQDIDDQLEALSQKYQDNFLAAIHQAEALQKTVQTEYADSEQVIEDIKRRIQILRGKVQDVKSMSMETSK